MKKLLPILFSFFVFFSLFFVVVPRVTSVSAQSVTTGNIGIDPNCLTEGNWCTDPDVTFVGKVAARSGNFLDWTLQNYNWVCVSKANVDAPCDNSKNPLEAFWFRIFSIVAVFFGLFILVTAFVLIVTRGQNLTFRKFIPRIFFVILFCVLSFSILRAIFVTTDAVEGFFLKNPAYNPTASPPEKHQYIWQGNLLFVGFPYDTFEGLRRVGAKYDESAFITLLLTKLTAITYYAMTGILLIRKIILWFFIIISPVFPILMLYYPVRNTAKIWVGEFFRWLLYAPLFAMLLAGLVALWRSNSPIPLGFVKDTSVVYPTAVNILLGGPGQQVFYHGESDSNSVNNRDTFALYAIALIMLWVVILLPFILLQIFLDYLSSVSISDNWVAKQIMSTGIFNRRSPEPPPSSPIPPGPIRSTGMARQLPHTTGEARELSQPVRTARPMQADTELLRLTNLSVPNMRDIAQYEISRITNNVSRTQEVVSTKDTLARIASPDRISNSMEREHYEKIRERLVKESEGGNPVARSILTAAGNVTKTNIVSNAQSMSTVLTQIANPQAVTNTVEREKITQLKETLQQASTQGNQLAATILRTTNLDANDESAREQLKQVETQLKVAKEKGDPLATSISSLIDQKKQQAQKMPSSAAFPTQNRVQAVSLEDYESVRKMWQENYKKLEVPQTVGTDRKEWIKQDIAKISHAIELLNSQQQEKVNEGMDTVSSILPFLLIGGFSQPEVVAYLKAKLEAAKSVLEDMDTKEQEEETFVEASKQAQAKPKEMTMAREEDEAKPDEKKELP